MSTIELQKIEIHPFQTTSTHETCLLEIAGRFFEIGKDTENYWSILKIMDVKMKILKHM